MITDPKILRVLAVRDRLNLLIDELQTGKDAAGWGGALAKALADFVHDDDVLGAAAAIEDGEYYDLESYNRLENVIYGARAVA